MTRGSCWERFFELHAPFYDDHAFTKHTRSEVDFLLEELALPRGASVLDVGCGTGRHAIELARRGYRVTSLDLSAAMLARAAAAARSAGVEVEWVRSNAADFSLPRAFDAAICLCEGAFGLLGESDDPTGQPLAILRNVARALAPRARAVFTVLNGMAMIRRHQDADVAAGRFDPWTLVASSDYPPREGEPPIRVRERGFVPTELVLLFGLVGLEALHMWGGTAGKWRRETLELDEIEIMIVAGKADGGSAEGRTT